MRGGGGRAFNPLGNNKKVITHTLFLIKGPNDLSLASDEEGDY